jgi:hypothetical protein
MDLVLAADLGRAMGAAIDAQLVAGSNASGQTLGLATVTGIKTVSNVDASPTAQEAIANFWAGYDQIVNGGQGAADPGSYLTAVHPGRLAFMYNNPQASQTIAPQVPGRPIACAGLRTNQGGGTEDEAFVLLADELPVFLGPIRLVVDAEGLSGTMQVQIVASRFVATGFGRAPAAICRVSGTAWWRRPFSS